MLDAGLRTADLAAPGEDAAGTAEVPEAPVVPLAPAAAVFAASSTCSLNLSYEIAPVTTSPLNTKVGVDWICRFSASARCDWIFARCVSASMQASYVVMSRPIPRARSAIGPRGRLVVSPFQRSWLANSASCICQNFPWSLAQAAASEASHVFLWIGRG